MVRKHGRKLRAHGARVEQGRRRTHVVEGREQVVELDGAPLRVVLLDGETHGDPHEEHLGQLEARVVAVDEVAVVQRLQPQIGELQVALGLEGTAQTFDVETLELRGQQFEFDTFVNECGERPTVDLRHLRLGGLGDAVLGAVDFDAEKRQRLGAKFVEQEPGRYVGVVGFHFDQCACRDEQARGDVLGGDAVVHVGQCFVDDAFGIDILESLAGLYDQRADAGNVQRLPAAAGGDDVDAARGGGRVGGLGAGGANPGPPLAVEHVVAGDLVFARPHQGQLHQVLNLLDVDGAAGGHAPLVGAGHLVRQLRDDVPDPRRGRGSAALDRQKRLGERYLDLVVVVGDHRAVALDDAELSRGGCHDGRRGRRGNVLRPARSVRYSGGNNRCARRIRLHGQSFSLVTLCQLTGYISSAKHCARIERTFRPCNR